MHYRLNIKLFALLIVFSALAACTSKPSVEGTWEEVEGDRILIFQDGSVTASKGPHQFLGSYRIVDESTMVWGKPNVISPFPIQYRLDDDTLVLELEEGEVVYRRQ